MSIEIIPPDYRGEYDLFADVNHDAVRDYTLFRLLDGTDVSSHLQSHYNMTAQKHPDFLRRLIDRGKFLEPVNEELQYIDEEMPNMRLFNAGVALASTALDSLAYEMGVESRRWRQLWTSLPQESDFIHLEASEEGELTHEDCLKIGDRLVANGQRAFEELELPYRDVYNQVSEAYYGTIYGPQIFQSSYGFVMRMGQKVIYSFSAEDRLDQAVEGIVSTSDINRETQYLVSKRERRKLRKQLKASKSHSRVRGNTQ